MYRLEKEQFVPASLSEVWDFFSSPENLVKITPEHMRFEILGMPPEKIYPGLFIRYRVSPFPGYRTGWTTEITHVDQNKFFVDEQRTGPYRIWHHEHHFVEQENGVMMRDIIHYQPPFGLLGKLANSLFIRKQLEGIFNHRKKSVDLIFGDKSE